MIARWNLARFAETLLSLIDDTAPDHAVAEATDVINGFIPRHEALWLSGARAKLGLTIAPADGDESDSLLVGADVVARQMGVSPRTVWRLLSAGKLIEPVRVGGSTRWRSDELRQWISRGCPPPNQTQQ